MRKVKLTKAEKEIEDKLLRDEYIGIDKNKFKNIVQAISSRKKDSVISLRVNSQDLRLIKKKAHQFGVKYQTFISELIHRVAHG